MGGLNTYRTAIARAALLSALVAGGCDRLGRGPGAEEREAHYITAQNLAYQGQKEKAIASFEQAILVNPSNAAAHLALGDLYHDQGAYIYAAYHYSRYQQLLERRGQKPDLSAANRLQNCEMQLAIKYSRELSHQQNDVEIENLRRQIEEKNSLITRLQNEALQRSATQESPDTAAGSGTRIAPVEPLPGSTPRTPPPSSAGSSAEPVRTPQPNPPAARSRPSPTPPTAKTHTVRSGETPYVIARRHGVSVKALLAANPGVSPTRMRVGTVLKIPAP
jgi:LysM repeat protein